MKSLVVHLIDNAESYGAAVLVALVCAERLLMALFNLLELARVAAATTPTKHDDMIVAAVLRGIERAQKVVGFANKWLQPLLLRKPKAPGK